MRTPEEELRDSRELKRARWLRDPVVLGGAAVGAVATGWAVLAGRYLPYIDWAAHLGLISVLAGGGETGALDYFTRSFAPSPYLLFYLASAAIAQLAPVDVAAALVLCVTAALLTLGAAALAAATGRDPRLAAIAPLAMFGVSMGWGFGSFVVATPLMFFALAASERALETATSGDRPGRRAATVALGAWLALLFLGHGFLFFTTLSSIGLRALSAALTEARRSRHRALELVAIPVLAAIPAVTLALPATITLLRSPSMETGARRPEALVDFYPLARHLEGIGGDLLERGSPAHWTVMQGTLAWLVVLLATSIVDGLRGRPREPRRRFGLELHAAFFTALYLFGPMTVEWPSSIWMIYPRFAVIAALLILLLPRVSLRGARAALVLPALVLVAANAELNARHVRSFTAAAAPYDGVRALIPPGQRILQLTVPGPGEPGLEHHAMGSLWAYLMVDGASYVAFLFDKSELPVHSKPGVTPPRAPHWTSPGSFDPRTHGTDYDYLVLRGGPIIQRTHAAGLHELVAEVDRWVIFRTKSPSPRPPR